MSEEHLATKEDVALLRSDMHKEIGLQTRWLIGILMVLQIPTWIGMGQIWLFLANIASKLPK
jgi:hypothetical protein